MKINELRQLIRECIIEALYEGKQVGKLYHFTSKSKLNKIRSTNELKGSFMYELETGNELYGVSTTRNKNLLYDKNKIRITLDGDKLSYTFKIQPRDYWERRYNIPDNPHTIDEDEEVILTPRGSIPNIDNYILAIDEIAIDTINEDYLGRDTRFNFDFEYFKNPKSIKRMASNLRAVSDENGNLFVVDDASHIVHIDLADWLQDNGHIKYSGQWIAIQRGEILGWQRNGNSNDFHISESVSAKNIIDYKSADRFIELRNKVKQKNPQYNFILLRIDEYENEKFIELFGRENII